MKTPVIPAENTDLISMVKDRDRRFLLKWLIITALCLVLAIVFFKPAATHYGVPVAILMALGLGILPFFACGGWGQITDRGFSGTVEDLDFSVRIEMYDTMGIGMVKGTRRGKPKLRSAQQANYCRVTVSTDQDSIKTFTVRLPGDSEAFPLKVGNRIVKYRGLPYPAIVGCKRPLCTVCGSMDDDGKGECRGCGASLIILHLE